MKDQLIFDVTSAATILDSDSVGAFVRSSDGTLIDHALINSVNRLAVDSTLKDGAGTAITSTDVSGKQALDVRVAEGINVEVDLSHVDDSVRLGDGTNLLTSTTVGTDIGLDVNLINANIEVTQGTSPWVVSATDLDVRTLQHDLDSNGDSVRLGDGTNFLTSTTVNSDIGLDVNIINDIEVSDAALANTAILASVNTLTAAGTAQKVVATNLADRKYLHVYNNFNRKVYIGGSAVTEGNGFPMSPGSYIMLRAGAAVDVYFDSNATGAEVRALEQS